MSAQVNSSKNTKMSQTNYYKFIAITLIVIVSQVQRVNSCRGGFLIGSGVSAAEKQQILDVHNQLRAQVALGQVANQPSAQNMQEMVWDDELAAKAQQWSNECVFDHDPSRYLDRFTMGQNLATIWSTIPLGANEGDFPSRIQNWFNEVQKYAWGAKWSPATGHYSQLVWGESNLIGCGFSYYKDHRRYNKLYVCNYGPGGNVVGSKPYEVGQPSCQSHGMYPSSRYSGLCISTQKYYTPQNEIITQNTYTFKTERINPVKYQTYKKNTFTGQTQYQAPVQQQQTSAHDQAVQAYEQALADYNQPGLSYEDAQEKYQIALQYYAAAYSQPKKQAQRRSGGYSRQPTSQRYNWAAYFGKK